jgi:hypothetical protein
MSDDRDSDISLRSVNLGGKPARSRLWGFVPLLGIVGFIALMFFIGKSRVKGDVTLATSTKTWVMHVNACRSGERKQFFGVMFFDEKQPETGGRLALPEEGEPHISLNRPDADYAVEYRKSDCKVWDVDLQRSNSTYHGIWAVEGHARFDCSTSDETASHATGDLKFSSCH